LAAPVNRLWDADETGVTPVPVARTLTVDDGVGNGGCCDAGVVAAAGVDDAEAEADADADAELSGAGAVLKPAGRVTPLAAAQLFGSSPLGQQKPWVRQKEPPGQP